jgi:hypothetical protein
MITAGRAGASHTITSHYRYEPLEKIRHFVVLENLARGVRALQIASPLVAQASSRAMDGWHVDEVFRFAEFCRKVSISTRE